MHTFIKVQARGPFRCIHSSKLVLGGHFVACIRQSWSPIAIAIGLHGVSSTPAALRSLHFFSTPISPWARPDCVRWGSVTGRKKQEKKCNATHCAAFFSKPSARTKSREHFLLMNSLALKRRRFLSCDFLSLLFFRVFLDSCFFRPGTDLL